MSSSSSATATSTDAQTWVYPAPGAATPPVAATSNFGPVHLFDKMVLQWSPSTTPNEIVYVCFSESLEQSEWVIAADQGQPFTYQFTNEAQQKNASDLVFCHFYFSPSVMGNTVVFQFKNEAGAEIKTWEGVTAPTSVSKTVTSALSTGTGSLKSSPGAGRGASTSSAASTSTAGTSSGGSLSPGVSAGIGVGVAVAVIAIVAALFFFWRSRKMKRREQDAPWDRPPPAHGIDYKYGSRPATFPAAAFGGEMQGSPPPPPAELRGSSPEHELHSVNFKRG